MRPVTSGKQKQQASTSKRYNGARLAHPMSLSDIHRCKRAQQTDLSVQDKPSL